MIPFMPMLALGEPLDAAQSAIADNQASGTSSLADHPAELVAPDAGEPDTEAPSPQAPDSGISADGTSAEGAGSTDAAAADSGTAEAGTADSGTAVAGGGTDETAASPEAEAAGSTPLSAPAVVVNAEYAAGSPGSWLPYSGQWTNTAVRFNPRPDVVPGTGYTIQYRITSRDYDWASASPQAWTAVPADGITLYDDSFGQDEEITSVYQFRVVLDTGAEGAPTQFTVQLDRKGPVIAQLPTANVLRSDTHPTWGAYDVYDQAAVFQMTDANVVGGSYTYDQTSLDDTYLGEVYAGPVDISTISLADNGIYPPIAVQDSLGNTSWLPCFAVESASAIFGTLATFTVDIQPVQPRKSGYAAYPDDVHIVSDTPLSIAYDYRTFESWKTNGSSSYINIPLTLNSGDGKYYAILSNNGLYDNIQVTDGTDTQTLPGITIDKEVPTLSIVSDTPDDPSSPTSVALSLEVSIADWHAFKLQYSTDGLTWQDFDSTSDATAAGDADFVADWLADVWAGTGAGAGNYSDAYSLLYDHIYPEFYQQALSDGLTGSAADTQANQQADAWADHYASHGVSYQSGNPTTRAATESELHNIYYDAYYPLYFNEYSNNGNDKSFIVLPGASGYFGTTYFRAVNSRSGLFSTASVEYTPSAPGPGPTPGPITAAIRPTPAGELNPGYWAYPGPVEVVSDGAYTVTYEYQSLADYYNGVAATPMSGTLTASGSDFVLEFNADGVYSKIVVDDGHGNTFTIGGSLTIDTAVPTISISSDTPVDLSNPASDIALLLQAGIAPNHTFKLQYSTDGLTWHDFDWASDATANSSADFGANSHADPWAWSGAGAGNYSTAYSLLYSYIYPEFYQQALSDGLVDPAADTWANQQADAWADHYANHGRSQQGSNPTTREADYSELYHIYYDYLYPLFYYNELNNGNDKSYTVVAGMGGIYGPTYFRAVNARSGIPSDGGTPVVYAPTGPTPGPKTYTVTWDPDIAGSYFPTLTWPYEMTGVEWGDAGLLAPEDPILPGHEFVGWHLGNDGASWLAGPHINVDSSTVFSSLAANAWVDGIVLSAHYQTHADVNVTYYQNATAGDPASYVDSGIQFHSSYPVLDNDGITIAFDKPGWTFECWNTLANGNGTDYYSGDSIPAVGEGTKLYAQYSKEIDVQTVPVASLNPGYWAYPDDVLVIADGEYTVTYDYRSFDDYYNGIPASSQGPLPLTQSGTDWVLALQANGYYSNILVTDRFGNSKSPIDDAYVIDKEKPLLSFNNDPMVDPSNPASGIDLMLDASIATNHSLERIQYSTDGGLTWQYFDWMSDIATNTAADTAADYWADYFAFVGTRNVSEYYTEMYGLLYSYYYDQAIANGYTPTQADIDADVWADYWAWHGAWEGSAGDQTIQDDMYSLLYNIYYNYLFPYYYQDEYGTGSVKNHLVITDADGNVIDNYMFRVVNARSGIVSDIVYYPPLATDAPYAVEHWRVPSVGIAVLTDTDSLIGTIGATVNATPRTYPGYSYDSGYSGSILSGIVLADGSLVLRLYYVQDDDPTPPVNPPVNPPVDPPVNPPVTPPATPPTTPTTPTTPVYTPTTTTTTTTDTEAEDEAAQEQIAPAQTPQSSPAQQQNESDSPATTPVQVSDSDTALSDSGTGSHWALLNLLLAIIGALIAIVTLFIRRSREAQNEAGNTQKNSDSRLVWRLLNIAAAIVAVAIFLFTEDMTQPMALFDWVTIVHAVIAVIQVVLAAVISRQASKPNPARTA